MEAAVALIWLQTIFSSVYSAEAKSWLPQIMVSKWEHL